MRSARAALSGLLIAALAIAPHIEAAAETAAHKAKRGSAAHKPLTAPDVTGTIAKPSQPPSDSASAHDTEIPLPVTLPAASRARMRACGEAWRDMKLAGTTGDDSWREFASKCFVGASPAALAR